MPKPEEILKSFDLKVTAPRIRVLAALHEAEEHHLSAEGIYQILAIHGQALAMATIYRVLGHFVSVGLLVKHQFSGNEAIYELADVPHHDHLVCIYCKKVTEFEDELIEQRQQQVADKHNFQMTDHSLTIYGICSACRKQEKT